MAYTWCRSAVPPYLPISPCGVSYPVERAERTFPALCPGHVTLGQVPFGHRPSLDCLRRWFRSVVRQLLRYYGAVRLPVPVHHRMVSLDFPMRSGPHTLPNGGGISRFPCKVFPCMRRVFDRAGFATNSRCRWLRCGLPLTLRASAPRARISFRGSMAGLHVPLSTLHLCPHEQRRITRGRCGSLLLHRVALSSTTPCRFRPAHYRLEASTTVSPLQIKESLVV